MSYSQQHHESSYALITSHYYEEIYRHCYVQLSYNKADAEDCAQKVFLLLFERWHKIESTDNIRAWLYKTAGYVIKGHLRKNKKRTQPLDEEAESA
ncbi:MAG: RNA polymerase sigma factor, partial [Acetanaerobacterium sp.]